MENLWEGLDEPDINTNEFEEVFSKSQIKKKQAPEKQAVAKKKKEVLLLSFHIWSKNK